MISLLEFVDDNHQPCRITKHKPFGIALFHKNNKYGILTKGWITMDLSDYKVGDLVYLGKDGKIAKSGQYQVGQVSSFKKNKVLCISLS